MKLLRNHSLEGSIDVLSEQGLLTIESLREVPDVHDLADQMQFRTTAERAQFLRMTSTLQGAAEAGVLFAMTRKEALEHAISLGHVNRFSMWDTIMSRTGLGPSVPGGVASLHDAAANGDVARIEMLVRAGVPVGGQRKAPVAAEWLIGPSALFGSVSSNTGAAKSGRTSLHTAAEHDSTDAINALLGCGADIAATDKFLRTALHVAAASNSRAAIADLVHLGASVEAKDKHGATALHAAAAGDAADAVRELLQRGAKTEARLDKGGRTPLHAAAVAGAGAAVKALVEGGAKVEAADHIGITPLFLSAIVGKPASFKALVAAGADMNVKDSVRISEIVLVVRGCLRQSPEMTIAVTGWEDREATNARAAGQQPSYLGNTQPICMSLKQSKNLVAMSE